MTNQSAAAGVTYVNRATNRNTVWNDVSISATLALNINRRAADEEDNLVGLRATASFLLSFYFFYATFQLSFYFLL